jgi:hypothetical protein
MNLVFGSEVMLLGFWEYMFQIPVTVQSVVLKHLSTCVIFLVKSVKSYLFSVKALTFHVKAAKKNSIK